MVSVFFYAALLWYGTIVGAIAIGIYGTVYFARLFDITRRQFIAAIPFGVLLAVLSTMFQYFSSTHVQDSLYDEVIIYTGLIIASFVIACLIYFLIEGRRNLLERYNIRIAGLWPWEIKRLKNAQK